MSKETKFKVGDIVVFDKCSNYYNHNKDNKGIITEIKPNLIVVVWDYQLGRGYDNIPNSKKYISIHNSNKINLFKRLIIYPDE